MSSITTTPDSRSRLPSLTGLRFLAALSVFLFHCSLAHSALPPNGPVTPFADARVAAAYAFIIGHAGPLGVSFFFVLSGFVITWSSKPGEQAWAFLRRRVVKVYPNHIVMWAVALALFAWNISGPGAWIPNLLLIHDYFPNLNVITSVNPTSWSLSCEMLFYVAFPFLIRPLRKISVRCLWIGAGLMVAGIVVVPLIGQYLIPAGPRSSVSPFPDVQFWFIYFFPPSRLFEFLLGAMLALLVKAGKWPRIGVTPAAVLLLVGYIAALYVPAQYGLILVTVVPVGMLIASVANADMQGRRSLFGGRVMVWLGNVSFAFYLFQAVPVFYLRGLFGNRLFPIGEGILMIIGMFALTLLGAWLLHILVEEPMMRRWSRPRRPVQVTAPAPELASTPRPGGESTPAGG